MGPTIVDPCAAITEYYKTLLPADAPPPLFSTMALVHGTEAVGAKALRKGFAFNDQMDLAWALGFPYMRFVIDGFPAEESKAALAAIYDPSNASSRGNVSWADIVGPHTIALPRRGIMALVHQHASLENALRRSDAQFLELTAFRELDESSVKNLYRELAAEDPDPGVFHLYLEALVGPDVVSEALMSLIEAPPESPFGNEPAVHAVYGLIPIRRRLREDHHDDVTRRLATQLRSLEEKGAPDPDEDEEAHEAWDNLTSALRVLLHPGDRAREKLAQGKGQYGLGSAKWVDGDGELTTQCLEAQTRVPDVPVSRYCFTGTDRVLALELQRFDHYDARDALLKYVNEYTTIDARPLLVPILKLLNTEDASPMIRAWLKARATRVAPELERLSSGASDDVAALAQVAKNLIK